MDPASGQTLATIGLPAGAGCDVGGAFPDAVYAGCYFGADATARPFPRIDPATNSIAATTVLPANHGAAPVVIDGQIWLVGSFRSADGTAFGGLVRVDPASGEVEQWVSIGDVDPDPPVAADGAIWVGDDGGHRVLRYDVASLAGQ